MDTFLIGLGHKARHGKDTVAQYIVETVPRGTRIYSFATALKCYCRVNGWMTVKDGPILQYVGTELFRQKVDYDFWVRMLQYQIEEEKPLVAIIPDVRFPNEKEWIEKHGISVKVERLNEDGTPYVTTDRPSNHPSEIALDNATFNHSYSVKSGDFKGLQHAAEDIIEVYARLEDKLWSKNKVL